MSDSLRLVRDTSTGLIHRADCRGSEKTSREDLEEFVGIERADPGEFCECVVSILCLMLADCFSYEFSASDIDQDRESFVAWLGCVSEGLEFVLKREGMTRERPPDLSIIQGGLTSLRSSAQTSRSSEQTDDDA